MKNPKKAVGHTDRNVVIVTIKMMLIFRIFLEIKIIKLYLRNLDY